MNKILQMKNYEGRKVAFIGLYGSHNYNLNDETSDWDFKMFVWPTLKDLYKGNYFKSNTKIDGNDVEIKDIRELFPLFRKANPAYLELLVSKEFSISDDFAPIWKKLQEDKHLIANDNLEGLFKSIRGMIYEKRKAVEKDLPNEESNEGYKRKLKFGFDTKQLLHAIRLENMLKKMLDSNCNSFLDNYWIEDIKAKELLNNYKKNKLNLKKQDALEKFELLIERLNSHIEKLSSITPSKIKYNWEPLEELLMNQIFKIILKNNDQIK